MCVRGYICQLSLNNLNKRYEIILDFIDLVYYISRAFQFLFCFHVHFKKTASEVFIC